MLYITLKENISHGNKAFPFSLYELKEPNNHILSPSHWHKELEIFYVSYGTVDLFINDTCFTLSKNEWAVINKGDLHRIRVSHNNNVLCYAIVFDLSFISNHFDDLCQSKYINPLIYKEILLSTNDLANDIKKQLGDLIIQIIDSYKKQPPCYELLIKGFLYQFLGLICGHSSLKPVLNPLIHSTQHIEHIKKAIHFIEKNYNLQIKLCHIANEVNLSEYHFLRIFKSFTGMTPNEYLTYYRIEIASHLLLSTTQTITSISVDVGFSTPSYFIKVFNKYKNLTPNAFRKNNTF